MYFLALAVDFDGTIAEKGEVPGATVCALRSFRETGRRLLLVTGRELEDLRKCFPHLDLFDIIVAENGALLFEPGLERETLLAPPPSAELVQILRHEGVAPISVGRAIIATWRPHEEAVMRAIEQLGLELQIVFNKGAVMVLPAGVNKASGLSAALARLGISPVNVVGVGDAENDHAFLAVCGCSAAVANAVPSIKKEVDLVLARDHGRGVADLAQRIIAEDKHLIGLQDRGLHIGQTRSGQPAYLEPDDVVLVLGNSGCGKSSYVTFLTEQMARRKLEFCVVDPEGDYLGLADAITLGGLTEPPLLEDALRLLLQANINVVINVLALNPVERTRLFAALLRDVSDLRRRSGRPHWFVVDEAHYLLPRQADCTAARGIGGGTIFVTLDPHWICQDVLAAASCVIAMGGTATQAVAEVAKLLDLTPWEQPPEMGDGEFLLWHPHGGHAPLAVTQMTPRQPHHRHRGKYATGDVGCARSFYFRGPGNTEGPTARNLTEFLLCSERIDDASWLHHLKAGDYSEWFRHVIRDDVLAREAKRIETADVSARRSREGIAAAIRRRYVIPVGRST